MFQRQLISISLPRATKHSKMEQTLKNIFWNKELVKALCKEQNDDDNNNNNSSSSKTLKHSIPEYNRHHHIPPARLPISFLSILCYEPTALGNAGTKPGVVTVTLQTRKAMTYGEGSSQGSHSWLVIEPELWWKTWVQLCLLGTWYFRVFFFFY